MGIAGITYRYEYDAEADCFYTVIVFSLTDETTYEVKVPSGAPAPGTTYEAETTEAAVALYKSGAMDIRLTAESYPAATAEEVEVLFALGAPEVELTADIVSENQLIVPEGAEVTLELAGNSLSGSYAGPFIVNYGSMVINGDGDSCVYSTEISAQGRHAVVNYGTMTIAGGRYGDNNTDDADANSANRGNAVRNYGIMTIEGGYFTVCDNYTDGGYAYAIANGSSAYPNAEMIINDATVYGSINGLVAADGGTLTVNGGTYTLGDGTETNLWRVAYTSGNGTIILNDGTFTRNVNNGYAFFGAYDTGSIVVNGGTYTDLVHDDIYVDGDAPTIINGGTFGGKIVGELAQYNAGTAEELTQAISLISGGTVALTADIAAAPSQTESAMVGQFTISNDMTLDLGGKTLSLDVVDGFSYPATLLLLCINGADVTIVGDGVVDAEAGMNNSYGINILNDGQLTIENGTFYGAMTAVQVQRGSLVVNGGSFFLAETVGEVAPGQAKYIINCIDAAFKDGTATVELRGGTYGYDYTAYPEGEGTTYVADGCFVVEEELGGKTVYTIIGADTSWYNETDTSFTLTEAGELLGLAQLVNGGNDFAGKTIVLGGNVDLAGIAWTPVGNGTRNGSAAAGNAFKGTFDGAGYTITGLTCTGEAAEDGTYGLFGVVDGGTVKNFKLAEVSVNIANGENVGAVAGLLVGGGTISGVDVLSGSVAGGDGVGGLVGRMTISGTIENCSNAAKVSGTGKTGGIVSSAYYTQADKVMKISGCTNSGEVSSTAGYVGGIVGMSAAEVSGCTNSGVVTGNATSVGGVVGEQKCYGSITGCTNTALITNLSSDYGTGGIVGWVRYSTENAYEVVAPITVSGCLNTGSVKGGNDAGGIIGTAYNNVVVKDCLNTAASLDVNTFLTGKIFAAGIIGNFQTHEDFTGVGITNALTVSGNCSTTTLEQMTGNCKDEIVYNNDATLQSGVTGNFTSVAEWQTAGNGSWYTQA